MYRYRKEFQEPAAAEGFDTVESVKFQRTFPKAWVNKALILDYDGTLREHTGGGKYPTKPGQVKVLPGGRRSSRSIRRRATCCWGRPTSRAWPGET